MKPLSPSSPALLMIILIIIGGAVRRRKTLSGLPKMRRRRSEGFVGKKQRKRHITDPRPLVRRGGERHVVEGSCFVVSMDPRSFVAWHDDRRKTHCPPGSPSAGSREPSFYSSVPLSIPPSRPQRHVRLQPLPLFAIHITIFPLSAVIIAASS